MTFCRAKDAPSSSAFEQRKKVAIPASPNSHVSAFALPILERLGALLRAQCAKKRIALDRAAVAGWVASIARHEIRGRPLTVKACNLELPASDVFVKDASQSGLPKILPGELRPGESIHRLFSPRQSICDSTAPPRVAIPPSRFRCARSLLQIEDFACSPQWMFTAIRHPERLVAKQSFDRRRLESRSAAGCRTALTYSIAACDSVFAEEC